MWISYPFCTLSTGTFKYSNVVRTQSVWFCGWFSCCYCRSLPRWKWEQSSLHRPANLVAWSTTMNYRRWTCSILAKLQWTVVAGDERGALSGFREEHGFLSMLMFLMVYVYVVGVIILEHEDYASKNESVAFAKPIWASQRHMNWCFGLAKSVYPLENILLNVDTKASRY